MFKGTIPALAAAAILASVALPASANAANHGKGVTANTAQMTDVSSQRRYWRHRHFVRRHHWWPRAYAYSPYPYVAAPYPYWRYRHYRRPGFYFGFGF